MKWPIVPQGGPAWSGECSQCREKTRGPGLRALIKAFFRVLAILAGLDLGDAHFWACLLPCVSEKSNQSVNAAGKLQRAEKGRLIFVGIIWRHSWEFLETSILGPGPNVKWPIVPQGGPAMWVECSQTREKTRGPGLRALIKAFFRVLAILAGLNLGDAHFWACLFPCVLKKSNQSVNAAGKLWRAE